MTELLGTALAVPAFPPEETAALVSLQRAIDDEIASLAAPADAVGRYPARSVDALKGSGILKTGVPQAFGGMGASHHLTLEAQVRLGATDSAVAQIFKVHDELTREIFQYCPDGFGPHLAQLILEEDAILGLAVAEAGRKVDDPLATVALPQPDGSYLLDGSKIYTTGAAGADYIAVWAFDPVAGADNPFLGMQLNLVRPETPGVTIHRDWDVLGQRATDSGSITFDDVRTDPGLRASQPGRWPATHAPIRYQAGFAAVLTGLGIGAILAAAPFIADQSRPWPSAATGSAAEDPMVKRLTGELVADLAAAYSLVHTTADLLDAFERGEISRTQLAVPVYAAKSVASRAGLRATGEIFALMGTRSAAREAGFDRWWRNARTLSLHDPVDWKHAEIGAHVLSGWDPPFGIYT
jgi:alkylation response protein AidB-like acyl-CoA dehydrogenase